MMQKLMDCDESFIAVVIPDADVCAGVNIIIINSVFSTVYYAQAELPVGTVAVAVEQLKVPMKS